MIGTADGFWFSFVERQDGTCEYEFMHFDQTIAAGVSMNVDAMWDAFDRTVDSKRLEIDIAQVEASRATIH